MTVLRGEGLTRWRVRVQYREPTYERSRGRLGFPYRWTFEVLAAASDDARAAALEEFWRVARLSSVSWARVIVRVECTPATANETQE